MMKYFLCLFAALLVSSLPAYACDLCSVYNFIDRKGGAAGTANAGLSYRFTHYESNIRAENFESFPGQHLDSNVWQVFGRYNLTSSLGLQLNVPIIYRDFRRVVNGRVENGSESGVGDASVLLRYGLAREHSENSAFFWELFGGVKLPTGDSDPLQEEQLAAGGSMVRHSSIPGNLVGGDDITLGSGSYDFIMGTTFFHQESDFYFQGNLQYTYRQEGDYDFEYGDDIQWDVGPGVYFFLEDHESLSLRLRLSGEYKADDEVVGQELKDTDSMDSYLGIEMNFVTATRWYVNAGVDIPFFHDDSDETVTPRYRALASVVYKYY